MGPDPYAVLGLEAKSNTAEVKRAFRELAMRYHPVSLVCSQTLCLLVDVSTTAIAWKMRR